MIAVRHYKESDARAVGILIADTFSHFNLGFASPQQHDALMGPFHHARSDDPDHQQHIREALHAPLVLVAEDDDSAIIGVLRGRKDRLHSLFVAADYHRRGVGGKLMAVFEDWCLQQGSTTITMAASLYAVPFYQRLGYKKSTGVRHLRIFGGGGFPYQPMKKQLIPQHPPEN
jgi:GNAT superfamily N-acetyltransferase